MHWSIALWRHIMTEKDYSKLNGQFFDYTPKNLDMNDMFIHIQSLTDEFKIIGYGYVIKDGNKFMEYLDSIVEDKKLLDIFDQDKEYFKFDIENILYGNDDVLLDDTAMVEQKAGVYLGSLRIEPK